MASIGNPVMDVINQGGTRASTSFSQASRIASGAAQSFNRGASLALKLDQHLQEQEAKLYNRQTQAANNLNNILQKKLDNNFRDRQLKQQKINADRNYKLNKIKVAGSLIPQTTMQDGLEVVNPARTSFANKALNELGLNTQLATPNEVSNPFEGRTVSATGDVTEQAPSQLSVPKSDVNSTTVTKQVEIPTKPLDTKSSATSATDILKSISEGAIYTDEQINTAIANMDDKAQAMYASTIVGANKAAKAKQQVNEATVGTQYSTNTIKSQINSELFSNNVLATGTDGKYVTLNDGSQIPSYVVADKNGNIVTTGKASAGAKHTINPEAVVVNTPIEQLPDLMNVIVNSPTIKPNMKNNYVKALVKYRPQFVLNPDMNQDMSSIVAMAGMDYEDVVKDATNSVKASLEKKARRLEAQGRYDEAKKLREESEYTNRLASNMVKADKVEDEFAEDVDKVFNDINPELESWLRNKTYVIDMFRATAEKFGKDVEADMDNTAVKNTIENLKTDYKKDVYSEMKKQGYSPTLTKLEALAATKNKVSEYGPLNFNDIKVKLEPVQKLMKSLGKQYNALYKAIYGSSRLMDPVTNDDRREAAIAYEKFVDAVTEQKALQDAQGTGGGKYKFEYNGEEFTITNKLANELIAYQWYARNESKRPYED